MGNFKTHLNHHFVSHLTCNPSRDFEIYFCVTGWLDDITASYEGGKHIFEFLQNAPKSHFLAHFACIPSRHCKKNYQLRDQEWTCPQEILSPAEYRNHSKVSLAIFKVNIKLQGPIYITQILLLPLYISTFDSKSSKLTIYGFGQVQTSYLSYFQHFLTNTDSFAYQGGKLG